MAVALTAGSKIAGMSTTIPFDPYLAAGAVALSVFVGTLATIYPALKASKIDPSDALRHM